VGAGKCGKEENMGTSPNRNFAGKVAFVTGAASREGIELA